MGCQPAFEMTACALDRSAVVGFWEGLGFEECQPAFEMTACTTSASGTLAVIGPNAMIENALSGQPVRAVRPTVGFRATTPQRAAGTRTDPPPSMPVNLMAVRI